MTRTPEEFTAEDADLLYRLVDARRDIRRGFEPDPVPDATLHRILRAAHRGPSVGLSQPWDFLVVRDESTRRAVQSLAAQHRDRFAADLPGARQSSFDRLKVEAILDAPVNVVVTCDPTRGGRHVLGRASMPQTAAYSTACAVQNLWLAARAEGVGVGWVSFFDERELVHTLGLPEHLAVVAYLCVGFVARFPPTPELAESGWAQRRPLEWAVHHERWGRRALPGKAPMDLLQQTTEAIAPTDAESTAAARQRQDLLTKPRGSLGVLEDVSVQLCGIAGTCPPPMPEPAAVAVFAADHGVYAQGVTPWPQEVTAQMVANFLAEGAAVNALARQAGAEVLVVDVGVAADLPAADGLLPRKVRRGTRDLATQEAMTRDEARAAMEVGVEVARDLVAAGNRCLLAGDMGIANTTASAALVAAFTGREVADVTGHGTGVDAATWQRKVDIVSETLRRRPPDPDDALATLASLGGLEHAAITGFVLGAAASRVPVVLDGVVSGAAALVATALAPDAVGYCVAGHRSTEPGHRHALQHLGLRPMVDLDLRLGEGSGAVLALPLVQSAARVLREMATFDSAGVTDKSVTEQGNRA
ncbi:MAG TPA: nicotinate-nucleotide--dimethylbenzimidazole phosphoribosyltransferase [Nocardioidaceae bacterium]|nr:nicotinate-nucleotide--dimethylbenzimidazole phosphoribosyltransferase [Nocardioidaceae bacterium]